MYVNVYLQVYIFFFINKTKSYFVLNCVHIYFMYSDYQSLQDKYDTLSLNVSSQSKQFKKLKRKLKDQETNNEFLEEKLLKVTHDLEGKFVDFSKNCTQELHLASSFMSQLQTQCQTLTTEFKENEEKQDTKVGFKIYITSKIITYFTDIKCT